MISKDLNNATKGFRLNKKIDHLLQLVKICATEAKKEKLPPILQKILVNHLAETVRMSKAMDKLESSLKDKIQECV